MIGACLAMKTPETQTLSISTPTNADTSMSTPHVCPPPHMTLMSELPLQMSLAPALQSQLLGDGYTKGME